MKAIRFLIALSIVGALFAIAGARSANAQTSPSYSTGFQLQNLSSATANVTISYYAGDNAQAATTFAATLQPNGLASYATLDAAGVTGAFSGSAVISSDQKVAATVNVLNGGSFFNGASYSGFSAGAKTVTLPILFKASFGFNTLFNIQNTGTATANVTIRYSGTGLQQPREETTTIAPNTSKRFAQAENANLPAGFFGSAIITSDQDVAVAVIQQGPATTLSYNGFTATSTTPVFPLINTNNAGLRTGIALQNTGTQATEVEITYTPSSAQSGTACTEVKTIPAQSQVAFAIDAFNTTVAGETCANGALFVGAARVTRNSANQPLVGIVNQNSASKGGAYNGVDAAGGSATVVFPLIQDRVAGYFTGFSIANLTNAAVTLNCTFTNTQYKIENQPIPANGVFTITQDNKIAPSYNGAGTCTATGTNPRIAGIVNQFTSSRPTDSFFVSNGVNN